MKALLLDLDDTLLDDRNAVGRAFAAFIEAHRHRFPGIRDPLLIASWREIAERHWRRFERGEISFQEQRRHRVRDFLGQPFTDAEADEAFQPYLAVYRASWRLMEETQEFMRRTEGLPKVIVTNGEREQQLQKIQATGLQDQVTAVVTPMDCGGSWKPDRGIFLAALGHLGVDAPRCAMIGDDEVRDMQPARELGMKAFRVQADDPGRTLLRALDHLGF